MVNARINWMSDERPPNQAEAEAQILRELDELTERTELDKLIFHNVFLGETMNDASVFVTPCDDDPTSVDCWYSEKTSWTPMGDIDEVSLEDVNRMRAEIMEGPLPGSTRLVEDEI